MESVKNSYTIEEKIQIVNYHRASENSLHKTAEERGVDRKSLREWISNYEKFQEQNNKRGRRYVAYT